MRKRVVFSPEARQEFEESVAWYERQQPGCGLRFADKIEEALNRIVNAPERFRLVSKTIRVARVKVFDSYSVYFHIEREFIGVISVFHGSRRPEDIKRRLT